jgi:hypothetical protein
VVPRVDTRVIDVATYGANGQDDRDDTVAIQAAISAAAEVHGANVRLERGTYYLSDQPPLDQVCLRIVGVEQLSLTGAGEGATHLVLRSAIDAHMISIADAHRIEVSGLSIDGTRIGRRDTHGIRVASSSEIRLHALDIHATAHYGIGLQHGTLRQINIDHVRIDDTGGDGIDFKNTNAENDDLELHDLRISRPGQGSPRQTGIDIRGRARLWNIEVTQVPEGATGVRFREDGPDTGPGGHDSSLREFSIEGAPGSTGVAVAANGVRVSQGRVFGTDTGVIVLGSHVSIDDVAVSGARYAFRIGVDAEDTQLLRCQGDSSRAGLWLEGQAARVQDSSFSHNQRCGVCVRPGALRSALFHNQLSDNSIDVDDQSAAEADHE